MDEKCFKCEEKLNTNDLETCADCGEQFCGRCMSRTIEDLCKDCQNWNEDLK